LRCCDSPLLVAPRQLGSIGLLQVDRLGAFAPLVRLGIEGDARSLGKRPDTRTLDGRHVDEHVLAPVIRRDEAVALLIVVKLDRTNLAHLSSPRTRVIQGTGRRAGDAPAGRPPSPSTL